MPRLDLLVVGELNPDLVLSGDVVPAFGQAEQLMDGAELVLGSSGAITACAAARLGLRVGYVGVVGRDVFGDLVRAELARFGVDTSRVLVREHGATGLTVVLVPPDRERAMLTHAGVMASLRAQEVGDDALADARHVHVSSPFLQPGLRPGLAALLTRARAAGATTSLDPGWDPAGAWELADALAVVDLVLPNAAELHGLTGEHDPARGAARLAARGPEVVVKLGADGALGCRRGEMSRMHALADVTVVDSTGAGDAFGAGVLAARLGGADDRTALALGCAAGALAVGARGGTAALPDRAQADALARTLLDGASGPEAR